MVMDRHMRVIRPGKSTAQDVQEFAEALQALTPVEVSEEPVSEPETGVHESAETAEPDPTPEPAPEPVSEPEPEPAPKPKRTRKKKAESEPENDIVDMLLG